MVAHVGPIERVQKHEETTRSHMLGRKEKAWLAKGLHGRNQIDSTLNKKNHKNNWLLMMLVLNNNF